MATLAPPAPPAAVPHPPTPPPPGAPPTVTVLIQLLHRYLDLREADTEAAAVLAGLPPLRLRAVHPEDDPASPFRLADLPTADGAADALLARAMLIKVRERV